MDEIKIIPKKNPFQFKKGHSPIPGGGRPKGTISLTSVLKRKLAQLAPGKERRTYAEAIVEKTIQLALEKEDTVALKTLWAYIDGLPAQSIDSKIKLNGNITYDIDLKKYGISEDDLRQTAEKLISRRSSGIT